MIRRYLKIAADAGVDADTASDALRTCKTTGEIADMAMAFAKQARAADLMRRLSLGEDNDS